MSLYRRKKTVENRNSFDQDNWINQQTNWYYADNSPQNDFGDRLTLQSYG